MESFGHIDAAIPVDEGYFVLSLGRHPTLPLCGDFAVIGYETSFPNPVCIGEWTGFGKAGFVMGRFCKLCTHTREMDNRKDSQIKETVMGTKLLQSS